MADENQVSTATSTPISTQIASSPVETSATVATPVVESAAVSTALSVAPENTEIVTTVLGSEPVETSNEKTEINPSSEIKTDAKSVEKKVADAKTDVKTETKPVEQDKKSTDGAEKATEVKQDEKSNQSDEPAPLPSYEPWKLPENLQIDENQLGEINKMFGEFEIDARKDPHAAMQKFGQQMIDKHIQGLNLVAEKIQEQYQKVWKDQTANWYESFVKDPEIGGERKEETAAAAREFIRRHGGTPEQQNELRAIMKNTGLGNHPAVIRAFAKATANLSEPKAVPAKAPPAQPVSRKQRFYGAKSK